MAYTVKQLSKLSGVTVRALHFYEEVELLQPAYYGSNGYRYYEEKELLQLQQILFFKELGFSLKEIQKVLGRSDFDRLAALHTHKKAISREWERLGKLLETIDNTINHLKGSKKMNLQDIYVGFESKEKYEEYQNYLKNRFGNDHPAFAESEKNAKKMSKADHEAYRENMDAIMQALAYLLEKQCKPASREVQQAIRKLYDCIKTFWTPDRETFPVVGELFLSFEWKKFFQKYDPHHPRLAQFVAEGMRVFAEKELP
ncbi:MAG: MerR family transcriptional regulator [Verrucomicrobia bacterium]|nr:MerR family transcriptional regulator [Verrucomicrobiota bacterium]